MRDINDNILEQENITDDRDKIFSGWQIFFSMVYTFMVYFICS